MPNFIFDNPLSRRLANYLEYDHNRRLGIRNTMRVARVYNRVKNHRFHQFRQELYRHQLEELFAENDSRHDAAFDFNATVKMTDGWTLDDSHALPYLERLLAAAREIIEERGGLKRGGGHRSFFQQIITDDHIAHFPAILDFATSSPVLRTVINYLGFIPVLSVSQPLGVRLAESDARFADPSPNGYRESQLFHRDYHDAPMVYVIVALRDVTQSSGPFSFLPGQASQQASKALRYGQQGRPYRITDDEMYSVTSREGLIELVCPAGTVLFIDSSSCFHYGSRDAVIPRYLMMFGYVSVCRTDFGDLLWKESPTLVVDNRSRTRRAKYPVQPGDSRLRRLVLDREFLDESRSILYHANDSVGSQRPSETQQVLKKDPCQEYAA